MMRFTNLLIIAGLYAVSGFAPSMRKTTTTTQLNLERRELLAGILELVAAPAIANAKGSTWFYDQKIETVQEPAQMHTGGKVDLNAAFVVSKSFCIMYPG
jgi:hypothetical protein